MNRNTAALAALQCLLPADTRQRLGRIDWLQQVDSSNSALLREADGLPNRAVLVVDAQTAGRGRRGRAWQSPPSANLYLSLFARLDCPLSALAGLSIAVGICLVEALRAAGVAEAGLKWPNDLVARERKLGGLLVESTGGGSQAAVVVGLGLNLAMPAADADVIDQPWIDMATLGQATDRVPWAACAIDALLAACARFERDGFAGFASRWPQVDALAGRPLRVLAADREHVGQADGIAGDGGLRMLTADGLQIFHSGEVSLRQR